MKKCPSCQRTYTDDAQAFCMEDGTPLIKDEPRSDPFMPTVQYSPQRPTTPSFSPPAAPSQALATPSFSPRAAPSQALAIASLIIGIVSFMICYLGLFSAPVGIVLGIVALSKIKGNPANYAGKGLAIAGIALGILSLGLWVLLIALGIVGSIIDSAGRH